MTSPSKNEGTLADRAYRLLRQDIVEGRLAPGQKLKLEALMETYSFGMSPLREALSRLTGDLLVITEAQRGFWVAPLSLDELDDISRVRSLVESEAVNLSIRHGGDAWLEDVKRAFDELSGVENALPAPDAPLPPELGSRWEAKNRAFHHTLVSACNSPWLMRVRDLLYSQSERYRRVSLKASRGRRSVHEEHLAIFEATIKRDALRACRMTELHVQRTTNEVRLAMASLQQNPRKADALV